MARVERTEAGDGVVSAPEVGLVEYRRTSVVKPGIAAYGVFYRSFFWAWGITAVAFIGYVIWGLTVSPNQNLLFVGLFCLAALLQAVQAFGLLRHSRWSRVFALVQASAMSAVLGFLLVMILTWPGRPKIAAMLPTLTMIGVEWTVATGLVVVIVRSWVIDHDLRRALPSNSNSEL